MEKALVVLGKAEAYKPDFRRDDVQSWIANINVLEGEHTLYRRFLGYIVERAELPV